MKKKERRKFRSTCVITSDLLRPENKMWTTLLSRSPCWLVQTCSFPLTSLWRQTMLTARFVGVTDVVCLNWDFYLHFAKLCNQCIENWSSVKHILFYHDHWNSVTEYGSALSGCGFLKESPELGDYLWSQWHTIHREALPRKLIRHKKLNVFRHFCADYVKVIAFHYNWCYLLCSQILQLT